MQLMSLTRFLFQPILSITTTVVTACVIVAPSQAANVIFSSPGVLSGINGVSFTLPSTGVSNLYNITLERGTVSSIFGTPPKFDILNEADAGFAMNLSAQGINNYLSRVPGELWFESVGTDVFYLPYAVDPNNRLVHVSVSKRYVNQIKPSFTYLSPDDTVVYARLVAVPEPNTILGSIVALGIASSFTRQLKLSKSTTEKELEKVS